MTALTLGTELALVQIGVAVYAVLSNLGKDFRYVARITRYILVQSTKWKVCCRIVVKLNLWAKRRPTGCGVAILAWYSELPMRACTTQLS